MPLILAPEYHKRSLRLHEICPDHMQRVYRASNRLAGKKKPVMMTDASRWDEEQFQLWRKGREIPGEPPFTAARPLGGTVTNANGRDKRSAHQLAADGYCHATDWAFFIDGPDPDTKPDRPSWDKNHPWDLFGKIMEEEGLKWGLFRRVRGQLVRYDFPHVSCRHKV